ncbi:MAG: hypothetical protein HKN92_03355 [Chitinophagales bacterium]|nr:hypothetical protein [Chitinophagales bacterium]
MKRISLVIAMIAMISVGINAQETQTFEQKTVEKVEVNTIDFEKAAKEKIDNRKEVVKDTETKKVEVTKAVSKPDMEEEPKQSSTKGSCSDKAKYASSKKKAGCCASKKAQAACASKKKSASTSTSTTTKSVGVAQ